MKSFPLGTSIYRSRHCRQFCGSVNHLDVLQMIDSGSERPGYELDDLVDFTEDTFSKLSDMDHCIPLEDLTVSLLFHSEGCTISFES